MNEELKQQLKEAKKKYNDTFSKKFIGYKVDNNVYIVPDKSYIKGDIILEESEEVNVYIPSIVINNIVEKIIKTRNEKAEFKHMNNRNKK